VSPTAAKPKAAPKRRAAPKAAKAKPAATRKPTAKATATRKPTAEPPCLVVGYDGSDGSRTAVSWAAGVLPTDGRIVLVYSCRPLHAPRSPLASPAERRRLGRAVIDELMLEAPKQLLEREVAAEISDRDPVRAMTAAARRHGASGIVVGTRRHSRLQKAIGTVTGELLKSSPVPVTVVPHTS
jgi:nucleotide-binding universal stress UspA family protein